MGVLDPKTTPPQPVACQRDFFSFFVPTIWQVLSLQGLPYGTLFGANQAFFMAT